jgi:hypothetical protein
MNNIMVKKFSKFSKEFRKIKVFVLPKLKLLINHNKKLK